MATELTDLIFTLRNLYLKNDNEDIKRAILLLGSVVEHQIDPTDRDLQVLAQTIAEIEAEDEEDSDEESDEE
jgi:hypothetical protein